MDKNAKIYVAGNTGLVGSSIVRNLLEQGYTNLVFTPYPEYDLRDQKVVDEYFAQQKPEYVFVAAAKVGGIYANETFPAEFLYDNLIIEANIIHAAHIHGVAKLLFLGSSCIYPKLCPQPIKEEYLLTGELELTNEPYAIAKIAGIKLCQYYRKQYGDDYISVMPTNLFGPGDNYHLANSHVLPAMIRKMYLARLLHEGDFRGIANNYAFHEKVALSREEVIPTLKAIGIEKGASGVELRLWGSGQPKREFLFVDDLSDCLIYLMNNYSSEMHINAGMGKDSTINEIAAMVKTCVGFEGTIGWDTTKPDGTPQKLLDVNRLSAQGWIPRYSFREALQLTVNQYMEQFTTK